MTAVFSGAVKIGDLNDFIAPSQACVVALNGSKQVAQDKQAPAATQQVHAEAQYQRRACISHETAPADNALVLHSGGPGAAAEETSRQWLEADLQ